MMPASFDRFQMKIFPLLLKALVASIFISKTVFARSIISGSETQAINASDLVLELKILRVKALYRGATLCGYTTTGLITKEIKGKIDAPTFAFGFQGGLEKGHLYRIYLKEQKSPADIQKFITEETMGLTGIDELMLKCQGIYPHYYRIRVQYLAVP